MAPIYHFSVDGKSYTMREDTIRAMEFSPFKSIYEAGMKCIHKYNEVMEPTKNVQYDFHGDIDRIPDFV
jgi:hypothetical protein